MNYVSESILDEHTIQNIRKRLRQIRIRKQYKPALVYQPKHGKYFASRNRSSLKATFYDALLRQWMQSHMPHNIEIPEEEHIDIIHYSQEQYFKEHTDFVNTFPHGAIQVSILVGLKDTKQGGTTIRIEDKKTTYDTSIRKGGVLIFNSLLPHSGEPVIGEKEILVFTGYLFPRRIETTSLNTDFCDKIQCFAVHTQQYDYDDNYDDDYDDENSDVYTIVPMYYFYQKKKCIAFYDAQTDACYRWNTPQSVIDMRKEQIMLIKNQKYTRLRDCSTYPLLTNILKRKNLKECFHQCKCNQQHNETRYRYEKEFCNGGDDYDVLKIPEMFVSTHCKWFSIALFNANYYAFWLDKIMNRQCPDNVMNEIQCFLQM
ncbi:MAG TPA: 2OG-Fe(II) oxygenase [Flavobacteriales bacterium]|nr:2OG-Fe(II) oxygenase [Flavobacteriales bacterium]